MPRLANFRGGDTGTVAMPSSPVRELRAGDGAKMRPEKGREEKVRKGKTSVACWAPRKEATSMTWPWASQRDPELAQVVKERRKENSAVAADRIGQRSEGLYKQTCFDMGSLQVVEVLSQE